LQQFGLITQSAFFFSKCTICLYIEIKDRVKQPPSRLECSPLSDALEKMLSAVGAFGLNVDPQSIPLCRGMSMLAIGNTFMCTSSVLPSRGRTPAAAAATAAAAASSTTTTTPPTPPPPAAAIDTDIDSPVPDHSCWPNGSAT